MRLWDNEGRQVNFCKLRLFSGLLVIGLLSAIWAGPARAEKEPVDLALVLAVDVSSSVNFTEFGLQMQGISAAFRHDEVWHAIDRGAHQRIAVALLQWAGNDEQRLSMRWTLIASRQDLFDMADRVDNLARAYPFGGTGLAQALVAAASLFNALPFKPVRKVIDISGDGRASVGIWPEAVRDPILARSITINGLPILNEEQDLDVYYQSSVIGGPGAFTEIATDYDDFADALARKLMREISGPWFGAALDLELQQIEEGAAKISERDAFISRRPVLHGTNG